MLNRVPETLESGDPTAAVAEPCDPPWETSLPYLLASTAFCKDMLQGRQAVDSAASQLCTCSLYLYSASNKQKGPQKTRPQSVALIPMTQGLPPANLKKIQPRQKIHGECRELN